jgi:hypothetical protein
MVASVVDTRLSGASRVERVARDADHQRGVPVISGESLDQVVEHTLAWCNTMRQEKGMEPLEKLPKGEMGNPSSCPCGTATGLRVRTRSYYDPANPLSQLETLPVPVREFVRLFDQGYLPEYDEFHS